VGKIVGGSSDTEVKEPVSTGSFGYSKRRGVLIRIGTKPKKKNTTGEKGDFEKRNPS